MVILHSVDELREVLAQPGRRPGRCGTRQEGWPNERNQYFRRCADRAVHDPTVLLEKQVKTADRRIPIPTNVSVLRTNHIATQSSLPRVWRGQRPKALRETGLTVVDSHWGHHMKTIKFVVKVNRGARAPQYVQRADSTPIQMTTSRKLALVMGRFTAEDAVKSLQTSRCAPELESVQVNA